jgi:hypothetical protein
MKKQIFVVVSIVALAVSMPVSAQKYSFDVENLGQGCKAAYKELLGTANTALPEILSRCTTEPA